MVLGESVYSNTIDKEKVKSYSYVIWGINRSRRKIILYKTVQRVDTRNKTYVLSRNKKIDISK